MTHTSAIRPSFAQRRANRVIKVVRRSLVSMFLPLLAGLSVHAQVQVTVVDAQDGAAVPFAQVAVLAPDSAVLTAASTNGQGRVTLGDATLLLREGLRLRAMALGYEPTAVPLTGAAVTIQLRRERRELREMVVTGQYAPMAADQAVHKVRVIDEERMQRLAANDLSDALRNELNIRLSQDNVFGTSLSMQGLGGQNVKVLIDGIPVIGRQDGNLDLGQIDLNGIERVEVVEGPLSVNYGSNALAGTINLITKKNAGTAPRLRLTAYTEHIGRLNLWGSASKRWGRHNLNLNLGRDLFTGWHPGRTGIPDLSPAPADTLRFQQWKPREQYNARVNYRWNGPTWQFGYKGEYSDDRITNRGRPRAPYYETAFDEHYHTLRVDNAVFADRFWENGRKFTLLAAHDRYRRVRNTWRRDLTDLSAVLVDAEGMQDTSSFTLTNVRAVYASAADSARLRYEFGTDLNLETGSGQRIGEGNGASIGDYAVYTSVEYRPVQALVLRPAVRFAYNTEYGAPLVPSFNLRWQLDTAFALRASYARGFRAPSLKELNLLFVDVNHNIQGNTDLQAEHSDNFGASLAWSKPRTHGAWRAEIGGFYNVVQDLITLAQLQGTLYSYVNIGQFRTTGGNLGMGWEGEKWSFTTGVNSTGRNDDLAAGQDQAWLWSHELRANITRTWSRQGLTAQVFYKYQGRLQNYAYDDEVVVRSTIEDYHIADASMTKHLWRRHLAITAGCKNLFDVQNLNTTIGASSGAHSSGGVSVPMMTGRTWFVRLELDLSGKER